MCTSDLQICLTTNVNVCMIFEKKSRFRFKDKTQCDSEKWRNINIIMLIDDYDFMCEIVLVTAYHDRLLLNTCITMDACDNISPNNIKI